MIIGPEAIAAYGKYGMPKGHMGALQQVASETNTVIGVRPVSGFARTFIEEGCPTKPFILKAKSAKIGIAAGLLVMDPKYGHIPEKEYKKHEDLVRSAFEKDAHAEEKGRKNLKAIPLVLTEQRINELEKLGAISGKKKIDNGFEITWTNGAGKTIQVSAIKEGENFKIVDENGKPLEVVGAPVTQQGKEPEMRPITADYDLLVVCPSYAAFEPGGKDKTPFRVQGDLKKVQDEVKAAAEKPNKPGPHEDPYAGNWNQRTQEIVIAINSEIAENDPARQNVTGNQTVHHNTDFHNPYAQELGENVPCLLVLPKGINLSSVQQKEGAKDATIVLIETPEELRKVRDMVYEQGYYWSAHAKYKAEIKPMSTARFLESMQATERAVEFMKKRVEESKVQPSSAIEPPPATQPVQQQSKQESQQGEKESEQVPKAPGISR